LADAALGLTVGHHRTRHPFADPILRMIHSALEQTGAQVEDAVRAVIDVTNINDADLVGRAHSEPSSDARPASTMV
jgi:hypothetical protein